MTRTFSSSQASSSAGRWWQHKPRLSVGEAGDARQRQRQHCRRSSNSGGGIRRGDSAGGDTAIAPGHVFSSRRASCSSHRAQKLMDASCRRSASLKRPAAARGRPVWRAGGGSWTAATGSTRRQAPEGQCAIYLLASLPSRKALGQGSGGIGTIRPSASGPAPSAPALTAALVWCRSAEAASRRSSADLGTSSIQVAGGHRRPVQIRQPPSKHRGCALKPEMAGRVR